MLFVVAFGDSSDFVVSFGVCGFEGASGDSGFPSCFAFSGSPPFNEMLFPPSPVNLQFPPENIHMFVELNVLKVTLYSKILVN